MKSKPFKVWLPVSSGMWRVKRIKAHQICIPKSLGALKQSPFTDYHGNVWPVCGLVPEKCK